ncbi:6-phosphogluconolactonase/glucosamine-6-phosphate isomerase/deaminase [Paenibacillus taihuensis]|uniref:6-phosphogluconolactonase/glucosamine-6-phosphate isomerase/deaminase n=1 Tax=Paenibacillus taihuensis TaxID=1156355 RepID=A0A3D9Q5P7_9BACL|nr:6-phosphogluconolactonase [Paenibacillus taihuensis]REE56308.1 6-phosphogluconolactonase/glucosamine-6-phosphate isomerase/deaminase [Paenibacillus taihuensis]
MIRIFETEEELAREIAREMQQRLTEDEQPVFCLASGSTPQKSYAQFARDIDREGRVKDLRIVSLDEWVGIDRSSEGSCYQMLNQDLFSLIPLESEQIEFFDGTAADLAQECSRIDRYIEQYPITFSLMGVGMNGHIGLNEPGSPVLDCSSVVELSATTKEVAQKYFHERTVLTEGITLGLGQVIRSRRVITAITGERKAEIVREIFCNPDAKLPAQALLGYEHIDFFLDAKAAKYLDISGEHAG